MGRRRYDPEAAREDIMLAAERLFVEKGFERTSTAEVARAAGVSSSQINYHFGNKRALWEEIHRVRFREYYEAQVALIGRASSEPRLLSKSIEAYFEFFQSHPKFARMMLYNLVEVGGMGGEEGDYLTRIGSEVMAAQQTMGKIRGDVHPGFALMTFLGAVSFWFMARHEFVPKLGLEGDPADWDATYLDTIRKILTRGMAEPGHEEPEG